MMVVQTPLEHTPVPQHCPQMLGPHACPSARQVDATPPSSQVGACCTTCVHCAMWLCAVTSWNGSQKAGKLGSAAASSAVDKLIADIQICGWLQLTGSGDVCEPFKFCGE